MNSFVTFIILLYRLRTGKHNPFFIPPGADAYRRDNPNATVQFLDTGHFALETHVEEIALAMRQFLAKWT
jgi:hypothetical protein